MARLLSRDHFREGVFARDGKQCVICKQPAVDAHHIIERRLWPDGGYYLENGASLCELHHIQAEQTVLGCPELRAAIGIEEVLLPPHLYSDQEYDKWGNPILPNGQRLRGELFHDPSVQKILMSAPLYVSTFTNHVKYPRTYHLPWSPNLTKDDRMMPDVKDFDGKEVVVTLKMDGENTTMYSDFIHARSLVMEPHESRNRVKALHGQICHEIPKDWRLCGENLYAEHSIPYADLPGFFMVFSMWNETSICLPWDETVEWAQMLDLPHVPVIYRGVFNRSLIEFAFQPFSTKHEGYVVRLAGSFPYSAFRHSVGKYVRKGHVHTHKHWMRHRVVPNKLRGESEGSTG